MADDILPAGSFLIDRDGLREGCALLKRPDGDIDILENMKVRASIRFDVDVETLALFVHDRPFAASSEDRPRGRRSIASNNPETLLERYLEGVGYAEAA